MPRSIISFKSEMGQALLRFSSNDYLQFTIQCRVYIQESCCQLNFKHSNFHVHCVTSRENIPNS